VRELLLDPRDARGHELGERRGGVDAREARDELPERAHRVRLGVRGRVLADDAQHERAQRPGQVQAHDVEHALHALQHRLLLLAARRLLPPALLGQVLVQREHAPEQRDRPVCVRGVSGASKKVN
jgi:hypothetical protein